MTRTIKWPLFLLATCLFSITVPAQTLPSLPMDSHVQKGSLRSGGAYYLVPGNAEKGTAEMAIVRRDEAPSALTRQHFRSGFLARHGIGPRRSGYFHDQDGATVFRFDQVPVYDPNVLDSTLLLAFSILSESTAEQALIVAGDIDATEVKKKMDIFSMMMPARYFGDNSGRDYVWEPSVMPSIVFHPRPADALSTVKIAYASPRTPQEQMNTAQALVMGVLSREYQTILEHRLVRNLRENNIPYARLEVQYLNSTETADDEEFAVLVHTDGEHIDAAMSTISGTLAGLDAFGASVQEFTDAKAAMRGSMLRRGALPVTNAKWVDRCIAHFLYGANLAPYDEEVRLFSRKHVADSTETRLFNNFSGALLGQLSNLTLEYRAPLDSLDEDQALFNYNLAYLYGSTFAPAQNYSWSRADSLGLDGVFPKVKLKSAKAEPLSGGTLWTLSNGLRVAYKPLPGSGMFSYALLLGAGLSSVPDLLPGEGGYFADWLSLCDVGGMPYDCFQDFLQVNGITMTATAAITTARIGGTAPVQKLHTVLKCLTSITTDRTLNRTAAEAAWRCGRLRPQEEADRLWTAAYPGLACLPVQDPAILETGTYAKADRFFGDQLTRCNDGMLILVGDLDEATVRKALVRYGGGFPTQRGTQPRKVPKYQPSGGQTVTEERGEADRLCLLLDAEYPLTATHYLAADLAAESLRRTLVAQLAPLGGTVEVRARYLSHPQERLQMFITCQRAAAEGLPEGPERPWEDLVAAARRALAIAPVAPLPPTDLKAWKGRVLSDTGRQLQDPDALVKGLVTRYGLGKDLMTRYGENINNITPDTVHEMLRALVGGTRVERITTKDGN